MFIINLFMEKFQILKFVVTDKKNMINKLRSVVAFNKLFASKVGY